METRLYVRIQERLFLVNGMRWNFSMPDSLSNDPAKLSRYRASMIGVALLFGIVNMFHFLRPVDCADCFFPYGLPFTFYREGGFAGGEGFVWGGVAGNLLVVLGSGAIFGWIWNWFLQRKAT